MIASIFDILYRFWGWWRAELLEIISGIYKVRKIDNRTIKISLLDKAGVSVLSSEELRGETLEESKGEVSAYLHKIGYVPKVDLIELVLPSEDVLMSQSKYPIQAKRKLSKFLSIDIQENFPFTENDIYSSSKIVKEDNGQGQFEAMHGFTKRSTVDALLSRLNQLDIPLNAIRLSANDSNYNFLPDSYGREDRASDIRQLSVMTTILLISIFALFFTYEVRQKSTLRQLKVDIAIQKSESLEVRKITDTTNNKVQKINALRLAKSQSPMVVEMWNDISRLLPRESEIIQLNYTKGTIRISGYSSSAGSLISILEADPKISNVTFSAPVTRDRRKQAEKYVISMSYVLPLEQSGLDNVRGAR